MNFSESKAKFLANIQIVRPKLLYEFISCGRNSRFLTLLTIIADGQCN
ncbi:MAG: hypothetical protein LBB21_02870 [Holosporaceae bacterium]|jgi:hypothetical protein|nr:hypothetical protein [Holosporaceae bacterium]